VAQSKGAFGMDSFAKYWLHNGFINVDNEKMSKSLGNFSTLRDIFEKYNPKVVRLMFLQTHYRNPINFSEVLLEQAKAALGKLHNFVRNLRVGYEELSDGEGKMDLGYGDKMLEQFEFYMDDDFNTSGALGAVFNLVGVIGGLRSLEKLTKAQVDRVEKALKKVDGVLGVIFPDEEVIEEDIQILIDKRNEARASRNFELADNIRDELKAKGVELEDTPSGVIWKKI
jgi:cysteinyl-tRNA synthetase